MNHSSKKLISITVSVSNLVSNIRDVFFAKKLRMRLGALLDSYLEFYRTNNVAQYNSQDSYLKLKNELNNLEELVEHIIYSEIYEQTPLLVLKRRICRFKLSVLRGLKSRESFPRIKEEKRILEIKKPEFIVQQIPDLPKLDPVSSKEKILNFIKKSKKIRTKDLVEEFSAYSERTVKRNLKDLTDQGVVKKEIADRGAVYYSVVG